MPEYRWKNGARVSRQMDPQDVGEHLEQLRRQNGAITARIVVDDAADPTAPTHPHFEWDDQVAADQYRLEQARSLVRSVVVQREDRPESTIRAFVVVQEQGGDDVYTSTQVALADVGLRQQVLKRALGELTAFERKYRDLEELAEVFAAAEKVKRRRKVSEHSRRGSARMGE